MDLPFFVLGVCLKKFDARTLDKGALVAIAGQFASWIINGHVVLEKTSAGTNRAVDRAVTCFKRLASATAREHLGNVVTHLSAILGIVGSGDEARIEFSASQPRYHEEAEAIAVSFRPLLAQAERLFEVEQRQRQPVQQSSLPQF